MDKVADFLLQPLLEKFSFSRAWPTFVQMKDRSLTIKDTAVDPQTINFWHKEGVLDIPKESDKKARKLLFFEYVWVCIVSDLRKIGVSIESMLHLREGITLQNILPQIGRIVKENSSLQKTIKENDPEGFKSIVEPIMKGKIPLVSNAPDLEMNFLEFLVLHFIQTKNPVSLIVMPDSSWFPLVHSKDYQSVWDYYKGPLAWNLYAHASVSAIIRGFLSDEIKFETPRINLLSPNEQRVLEIIGTGEYEHITIHFRDKAIKNLELTKTHDTQKRIVDVLAEGKYQEIIIQNHKGYITHIQNTIRLTLEE